MPAWRDVESRWGDPLLKQSGPLDRVSAAGGEAKAASAAGAGRNRSGWPQFLPDGKHYLYLSLGNQPNQQGIYAASLDSNDRKFLVATKTNAAYLQSGQLLFTRGDMLMAQPFDLGSLKLSGEPRPVVDHIELANAQRTGCHGASFAASPNGTLVWRRGASPPCLPAVVRSQRQEARRRRRSRRLLEPSSIPGRQQAGRMHPRSSDANAGHLDLRSHARHKDAADLRSRRRPGLRLVAGRKADRLHLRPLREEGASIGNSPTGRVRRNSCWRSEEGGQTSRTGHGMANILSITMDLAAISTCCLSLTGSLCHYLNAIRHPAR